jgi:1-deoxy-D-xylulose-5-phosphate synthase
VATGVAYTDGPIAMRYPRGEGYGVPLLEEGWETLPIGKGEILRQGDDVLMVAYGSMVHPTLQAAQLLSEHGIEATVINARFVKPLDTELILPLVEKIKKVVTIEEGCLQGGFGSAVTEAIVDARIMAEIDRIGVPDLLVEHASPNESLSSLGLTSPQIADRIRTTFFADSNAKTLSSTMS